MIVIPAIDIKGGRCVRLRQGEMSKETIYSENPVEIALKWAEMGAERIHLVDLDGAIGGRPVNFAIIRKLVERIAVPVQLGGGIRDTKTLEAYLDLGVHRVILGTVAFTDPEFVKACCRKFPGRIIIGIDARKGRVAVEGWTRETDLSSVEMARRYESVGISEIIYTDIQRDGMGTGPNIEATRALAEEVEIAVVASGGISSTDDVVKLLPLEKYGVIAMITGRALYEETIDLSEAIKLTKQKKNEFIP